MPKYGMTMVQAEITEWFVKQGDAVSKGDPILAIETEKTSVNIEAPVDGYVSAPLFEEGEEVKVGAVLLYIADTQSEAAEAEAGGGAASAVPGPVPETSAPASATQASGDEAGTPLSGIRLKIANNMQNSLQHSAQLTHMRTVCCDALWALKEKTEGVSINDLLIKQFATALARFDKARDQLIDGKIVRRGQVDIGLAVALGNGLIVPAIRNADVRSAAEIAAERRRLVSAAKEDRLMPDDMGGATATLSNLGPEKIDFFTPILNPPESIILGVGRIVESPLVRNGAVVVGKTLGLSLTFDHQVLDGKDAADFLDLLASLIEG